ncbi:lipoprotein-releasing ABC transporter permease subunit [Allosediminivita pacifica]|uniref:Lipoprotein-releasing system permease protein n=1 Tax=Allosediminivita pacifica TaxID=1267769 RepID=A0A2T6ABC7_9RHOB|nr:lipoprotein-releasing ABC transporter permease subunit [Allosediminivita pacifica]PTX41126.1 lipoprotein-releasing system permease protein [Allosediminivita pacifica]GGB24944.1 ABC transporter substrate-binding protein [Allosediminivita pacifica]
MSRTPPPFAPFEWMIAWRYLRARRAEGGVSVMTWISLIGITLAVFALVATLAVRSGFRTEFVNTILGANAHVTVYPTSSRDEAGQTVRLIPDYDEMAVRVSEVSGVTRVAPLVKGQVMAAANSRNAGVEVFGIAPEDLSDIPAVADPETGRGDLSRFGEGIAIGSGVARELGVDVGDDVRLISPDGVKTAFGTSPRIKAYEVTYVFTAGRLDIDRTRVYMPFGEAQLYFNREGAADELEVIVSNPEEVGALTGPIQQAAGAGTLIWTWQDASGAALQAIAMQDNALFILLAILVLIATMNIISGLVMLVKNKGRDIGILRTVGLTEGAIMRVFFIVGASIGVIGTVAGVALGVLFSLNIESVYAVVDLVTGSGRDALERSGFFFPPAELRWGDLASAVALSLGLSFVITIFPARRAARLNPVEALRYE